MLRSDSAAPQSHVPTLPTCNLNVWKKDFICLICFLFSVLLSSLSGPVSLSPTPFYFVGEKEGRRRHSREMMKFQGKVEVPSITGGGKVQINHLISPAFSPLSWGSRAKGKSITLYKWDMTGRSLRLCSGLWARLSLALLLDPHTSSQRVNKDEGPEHHQNLNWNPGASDTETMATAQSPSGWIRKWWSSVGPVSAALVFIRTLLFPKLSTSLHDGRKGLRTWKAQILHSRICRNLLVLVF